MGLLVNVASVVKDIVSERLQRRAEDLNSIDSKKENAYSDPSDDEMEQILADLDAL